MTLFHPCNDVLHFLSGGQFLALAHLPFRIGSRQCATIPIGDVDLLHARRMTLPRWGSWEAHWRLYQQQGGVVHRCW